jgi:protoheme IX farnesyltransferase
MIGWAAVTGTISWESFVLFAIIFMWTPPHFWALALRRAREYGRVGVPMLPVVAGPAATRNQILIYSVLLVPITLLPWTMGFAGALYGTVAAVLGALFLAGAVQVWRTRVEPAAGAWAMRLFSYSILYLFLLFGALLVEHVLGSWA